MGVKKALLLFLLVKITTVICNGRGDTDKYHVKERGIRCVKCNIGEYVADHCTEDLGYSTCKPCAENEYVSDGGATSCAGCTDCKRQDDKTVEYIKCTKSDDTVCVCPQGQIFEDGLCQKCPDNYIVDRTESNVDGKCVKCESGSFYDNKTKSCTLCSSCGDDEDIVAVCAEDQDVQCETKGLSTGVIVGISIGVLLGVSIIIGVIVLIFQKCKRQPQSTELENHVNRPEWIEPLLDILIQELEDYQTFFHKLHDLPKFNCRTRLSQLNNQHHRDATAVIPNFVYEYHGAAPDEVVPQTFATALEELELNATVERMRRNQILARYLNVVEDRQDPDTTPLIRTHQSTSQQTQPSSNNTANVVPSVDDHEESYLPEGILPIT